METLDKNGTTKNEKPKQAEEQQLLRNTHEGLRISGNWNRQSKDLREKFPKLNAEDVRLESGKENELINRLSAKLDKGRLEVISILKNGQLKT